MKTVGVNRAPIRIRPSSRAGDSGCDTFTKKKKQMKNKQKELNKHPESGSDPPIGSDRKGVLHSPPFLKPLSSSRRRLSQAYPVFTHPQSPHRSNQSQPIFPLPTLSSLLLQMALLSTPFSPLHSLILCYGMVHFLCANKMLVDAHSLHSIIVVYSKNIYPPFKITCLFLNTILLQP